MHPDPRSIQKFATLIWKLKLIKQLAGWFGGFTEIYVWTTTASQLLHPIFLDFERSVVLFCNVPSRKCALKTSIGHTFNLSRVVNHGGIKESLGDAQEFIEVQPRCKKKGKGRFSLVILGCVSLGEFESWFSTGLGWKSSEWKKQWLCHGKTLAHQGRWLWLTHKHYFWIVLDPKFWKPELRFSQRKGCYPLIFLQGLRNLAFLLKVVLWSNFYPLIF